MPKKTRGEREGAAQKRQFLGRVVNRSKVKRVLLLELGELVVKRGWFNAGYIFPVGYKALVEYKDIGNPQLKVSYTCAISERSGHPWFSVASAEAVFYGKSPTACWKQVLDSINNTLSVNGEPTVRTQVAGPEYFGLNDPGIVDSIESLDPDHCCLAYWEEKENILKAREIYEQSHPKAERKPKKKRRDEREETENDLYTGAWSCIQRKERYIKRLQNSGKDFELTEDDNPMPEYQDPITLDPVVLPALSPYGHVAGYYSWVRALRESNYVCPFTKLPLTLESLIKLNSRNFEKYKRFIVI